MAHYHMQVVAREWITVVVQGKMIGVEMSEIVRVSTQAAENVRLLNHRELHTVLQTTKNGDINGQGFISAGKYE